MTPLATARRVLRLRPWSFLAAVTLLQAAACPELQLPTGGGDPPTTITAPSNLSATAMSAAQINLAWTDNSPNETGFRIERAPGGTTTFAEIGTVAAGVTAYQNTGLTSSTQYSYRVRAYNASVNSDFSATATATTMAAPPTAPSNLLASGVSSTQINITWIDNSSNEDGFKLERSGNGTAGPFTEIAVVTAGTTSYQNIGLPPSTGFTYQVRAYNAAGNSAYSNTAVGFTQATPVTPPAAPSGLTATAASTSTINLAWTDNSNNEHGFHVERAPGGTTTFSVIATLNAGVTTYQSAGLTASTQYSYQVRAFNSAGNSAYSTTATATTLGGTSPPNAPSGLGATAASSTQINLSWTDNSTDEDGFRIERCSGAACSVFTEITTVAAGVVTYQNTGLTASTSYTYRVRAYNGTGNSSYSATATSTTPATPVTPPAAPSGLGASAASSTQINLSWTDNSADEDGFKIERAPGGTTTFVEIGTVAAGVVTYQNTGLAASTQYVYRVRAHNAGGNSGYSNTATATTNAAGAPPAAPSGLNAMAASSAQINLTWTDNSNNEDGFRIERCTGVSCSSFAEIGTVAAGVDNYQSTGLAEGTTYGFRVRAYNGAGNSAYSNAAHVATETPLPTLPGNLVATAASVSQINLTWSDWSTNETGFRIERCTGASCSNFVEITTVGANATGYNNTGLSPSTLYRYRVRAYNGGGNSSYSNEAEATTQAAAVPPTAPSNLAATAASSSQINLTWTDNSNNEDGFAIERCAGVSCSNFSNLTTVAAGVTGYNHTGLSASTSYSYRVLAYNGAGGSAYTATATATTQAAPSPPAAPSNLVATAHATQSSQIGLTWTDNASNETEFLVEQKIGAGSFVQLAGSVPANNQAVNITGLTGGTTYTYRIRASNANGVSSYSNEAGATTLPSQITVLPSHDNLMMMGSVNGNTTSEGNMVYQTGEAAVGCNGIAGQTNAFFCTQTAFRFNGLQAQIAGRTIVSATFRLYPYQLAGDFSTTHAINAIAAAWDPTTLTWNNHPASYSTYQQNHAPPQNGNAIDVNVTSIVQAWASGTWVNNGLMLREHPGPQPSTTAVRVTIYNGLDFYANQIYRPQLIITLQ